MNKVHLQAFTYLLALSETHPLNLIHAFRVMTTLAYCNSLINGVPQYQIRKIQWNICKIRLFILLYVSEYT